MKKLMTVLLAAAILFSFAACAKETKTPEVATIMKSIRSEIDLPDMAEIEKDRISGYYDVNGDDIEEMSYIIAGSGATTDEIFIVKMKDSAKADEMKKMMETRKKQVADLFATYNAAEMPKVDSCVIETNGVYAFFAICNDNAKAKKIFTDSF